MPRLQSGKIDRKGLAATMMELETCRMPAPGGDKTKSEEAKPKAAPKKKPADPETALALKTCQETLDAPHLTIKDDLHANGLDSISGAKLANAFAKLGIAIALGDIYTVSTVQELRPFVQQGLENPIVLPLMDIKNDNEKVSSQGSMGYCMFTFFQGIWNLLLFAQAIYLGAVYFTFWISLCYTSDDIQCSPNKYVASAKMVGMGYCLFFAVIFEAIILKWLLVGRYKAGVYPLFGCTHLSHWISQTLANWALRPFHNTVYENWILELLGAHVGRNAALRGANIVGGYDLITLGDRSVIGFGSELASVVFGAGVMRVGPITVTANSVVGTQCALMPSTLLEGRMLDLSSGSGYMQGTYDGVPGKRIGPNPVYNFSKPPDFWPEVVWSTAFFWGKCLQLFLTYLPWLCLAFLFFPQTFDASYALLYLVFIVFFGQLLSHVVKAIMCRCYGKIEPGVCERFSYEHFRIEMKQALCDFSKQPFGGTLLMNPMMRMFGYTIDSFSDENDVPMDSLPDMLSIGHEVFTTAGYITRPCLYTADSVITEHIHIGDTSLVGNVAVVQPGNLKSDLLVGVMTRSSHKECVGYDPSTENNGLQTVRYGRPAGSVPPKPGHPPQRPAVWKFVLRVFWESCLLLMPLPRLAIGFFVFRTYYYTLELAPSPHGPDGITEAFFRLMGYSVMTSEVLLLIWIFILKHLLIGRVPSGTNRDLWDPFTRCWQMSYSTLGNYFWTCPVLPGWAGYNVLGRLAGAKIGHRVIGVNSWVFVDPDMWRLGNDVAMNQVHPQAHTFEDHNLDLGTFHLKDGVTVCPLAMLMQNTTVDEGSVIGPLSCVMKSSELMSWGYYEGVPASRVADVEMRADIQSQQAVDQQHGTTGPGGGFQLQPTMSSSDERESIRNSTRMSMIADYGNLIPAPSTEITPKATADYDPDMEGRDSSVKIRPSDEFDLQAYSQRMGSIRGKK